MKEKIIEFWKENEIKIVFSAGLVLVALISFQGGYLKGKALKESPLVIEKTTDCSSPLATDQSSQLKAEAAIANAQTSNNLGIGENKNCAFVGSKNSNKYHLPTCQYAKTIKSENLVCFSSKEEAEKKGISTGHKLPEITLLSLIFFARINKRDNGRRAYLFCLRA